VFVVAGYAVIFIMSIILHEVAHGWVAERCGDPTARQMGRITLNPLKHIDLFNTIILPVLCVLSHFAMIGGPKPVPVNPFLFKNFRRDNILVSLAGVTTNFVIAVGLAAFLRVLLATSFFDSRSPGTDVLVRGVQINLLLGFFNLMPIPPLDGSHVVAVLLPREVAEPYERLGEAGFVILLALFWFPPFWSLLGKVVGFSTGLLLGS